MNRLVVVAVTDCWSGSKYSFVLEKSDCGTEGELQVEARLLMVGKTINFDGFYSFYIC